MPAKFEARFSGRDNAGLRKRIRETADGAQPACGPVTERAVLSLAGTVALTASGRETLAAVAADYRVNLGEIDSRCACVDCTDLERFYLREAR